MRVRYRWALGVTGMIAVGIALVVTTVVLPARQERLDSGRASLELGIDFYQQGAYESALAALAEAQDADPDDWRSPFYLGVIRIQLRQFDQAVPPLERAFLLNPAEPKIPNALGVAYFRLGRIDLARGYFATSLELDPTNADTRGMVETMTRLQRRAAQAGETPDG